MQWQCFLARQPKGSSCLLAREVPTRADSTILIRQKEKLSSEKNYFFDGHGQP